MRSGLPGGSSHRKKQIRKTRRCSRPTIVFQPQECKKKKKSRTIAAPHSRGTASCYRCNQNLQFLLKQAGGKHKWKISSLGCR